ncbi:MAG TPA: type 1 glutamine amidotransferase domain-containing protein [Candidatus Bathyarchaeia archaeon]|nr:type 1 glutamine amidotransferase domain-containing protein [Candidatus Bathyarchaeia archaeon]
MGDLRGRRAAIIVADEFEDLVLFYPMYRLQEEGIQIVVVGFNEKPVKGKHEYSITPDKTIDQVSANEFDFLVVPGRKSPERLRLNSSILEFVWEFDRRGKPIAAICHAGQVLASAGILIGRRMTCVESIRDDMMNAGANYANAPVVRDRNLVTSLTPKDLADFGRQMVQVFSEPLTVAVSG